MDGKYMPRPINDGDKIIGKTYMTIVVGENTRLRQYLARWHRKTLCSHGVTSKLNDRYSNYLRE